MEMQQTVAGSAAISGIALHTGDRATVRVHPAPENTGIVFRRVDLPGKPEVHALASNVVEVQRGTTIAEKNGGIVYTVEFADSADFLTAIYSEALHSSYGIAVLK